MSSSALSVKFIDNITNLADFLSILLTPPATPTSLPTLYLDLEGRELSRTGTISLLTLYHMPTSTTYLIDITTLSHSAFTTPAPAPHSTQSLKTILEDASISKVFFDVRNDSDALFFHYKISLKGIIDLQLLELGSRSGPLYQKRLVSGLARCIAQDANLTIQQKKQWEEVKKTGSSMFAPEKGGSYAVFNARPLKEEIVLYCVQDVTFLPTLFRVYTMRLASRGREMGEWKGKIERETVERVRSSQMVGYQPHGKHKALGPW
ncbi:hypothetical protein BDZ45DRAFT_677608 [Acephala macrosclerotiorum]|nr:hypothetical protein BDZ45DRAFT_677608 [Acephala macrosclerotiorum]